MKSFNAFYTLTDYKPYKLLITPYRPVELLFGLDHGNNETTFDPADNNDVDFH